MLIGLEKFQIGNMKLNIEIVDCIPSGYNFLGQRGDYQIYEKIERINNDAHHYYLASK